MKKVLLCLSILLTGCKSDREILCRSPVTIENGNFEIINNQCLYFGDSVTGIITVRDKISHKEYTYTMNVVDGKVVFNLTTADAIAIQAADDAAANSAMAASMAASAAVSSSSRR